MKKQDGIAFWQAALCLGIRRALALERLGLWTLSAGYTEGLGIALLAPSVCVCACVSSAYYHSGGHMISAFVYGCACGLESWNCVLLPCIALCWRIPLAAGLRFVTRCFVVLYRSDCTLCNTELEEFWVLFGGNVHVSALNYCVRWSYQHLFPPIMYVSEIRLEGVSLVMWVE